MINLTGVKKSILTVRTGKQEKRSMKKRLLGILLSFVMMLTMVPVLSQAAYAEDDPSEEFVTTDTEQKVYEREHTKITVTAPGDEQGFALYESAGGIAVIDVLNEDIVITKVECTKGYGEFTDLNPSAGNVTSVVGDVATIDGINAARLTLKSNTLVNINNVKVYYAPAYQLWVGKTQVTSVNKGNVLAGDPVNDGKVSYDPENNKLTLKGADISGENGNYTKDQADVCSTIRTSLADLTINVTSDSTVTGPGAGADWTYGYGIFARECNLTITGEGELTASDSSNRYSAGVRAKKVVLNGRLAASGETTEDSSIGAGVAVTENITISEGAELTAAGIGKRGTAIYGEGQSPTLINKIPGAGWTNAEGTEGHANIAVNNTGQDLSSLKDYKKVNFPEYILWVKGVQVTGANKDNVLAGDPVNDGKVSYDSGKNILTLKGANITAGKDQLHNDSAIYYGDNDKELIINATEASTVKSEGSASASGINSQGNLTVNGTLSVSANDIGITCSGDKLTVNGKVTVTGADKGVLLGSGGEITVNNGAELSASGDTVGIAAVSAKGVLKINEGAKVSAVGEELGAIDAIVKNAIAGTAWTNRDGTAGETAIEVNADRELGEKYKRVQFPAVEPVVTQYTITYDLNGGTLDGQTGIVTKKIDAGTVITLPAPARDGYTFDYWEGSKYNAGDKYTVTGDHTFKAVWKTGAGGDGKKGSGTKTGDENALGAWIVLMLAALAGTTGMAFARKRKGE